MEGRVAAANIRKMSQKQTVLFICTHNSARSQIAEGLLRTLLGDRYEAHSAGTNPGSINPNAAKVMQEQGIDISSQWSKSIDEFLGQEFDYVVTVCDQAKETCPFFSGGKTQLHEGFPDPSEAAGTEEERLAVFRQVRDDIKQWILKTFG